MIGAKVASALGTTEKMVEGSMVTSALTGCGMSVASVAGKRKRKR